MKLTILGTGNAQAVECYNTCFLLEENQNYFMVDAGGGNTILGRLREAGADWREVRDIFVTHKHIDHILGVVWMMRMICQNMKQGKYEGEARIYAHREVVGILQKLGEMLLQKNQADYLRVQTLEERYQWHGNKEQKASELAAGDAEPTAGDAEAAARDAEQAADIRADACAESEERFREETCLRLIIVEDGQTCGIIGHPVTFFDIHSTKAQQYGFTIALGGGERLTCCGDEPYKEQEEQYARGSKWLMHEAFCLHGQADIFKPYEKHHSTVRDAAMLANQLGVANLILYHTEDHDMEHRKERYTAEGRQYFGGGLYVPEDLEVFEL